MKENVCYMIIMTKESKKSNERHDVSHYNSNEVNASIMQDFEKVKEIEMKNNSAINDSNSDYLIKKQLSQELQHGKNQ